MAPFSPALIRTLFTDVRQRTLAITIWMMAFMGGDALGPLVGGVLLQYFWWGAVFLLAIPAMALLLVTGPFLIPESHASNSGRLQQRCSWCSTCPRWRPACGSCPPRSPAPSWPWWSPASPAGSAPPPS
ncbi:MFS transporter [Nonomuraea sp. bgisy101]|uniref:MFS transporter n=1 Tax=Nonomuraea sp. bgisy101 TaxID=3413784 RepID=UPI003D70B1EB